MTLRTRLAFMVVLLLLGCVFAAPFYRSATSQDPAVSNPSLPTLQIQRSLQPSLLESSDEFKSVMAPTLEEHATDQPKNNFTRQAPTEFTHDFVAGKNKPVLFNKPIPDLQMPAPNRGIRASSAVAPRALRARPVSLTGVSSQRFGDNPIEQPRLASNFHSDAPTDRTRVEEVNLRPVPMTRPAENIGFRSNAMTPAPRAESQRHRVSRYDSLGEISKQYYGSAEHALLLFEANRDALVSPSILPIGLELVIPAKPNRTPQVQAWTPNPSPNAPRSPEPSEKLPALPIENQFGWKRAQDERD